MKSNKKICNARLSYSFHSIPFLRTKCNLRVWIPRFIPFYYALNRYYIFTFYFNKLKQPQLFLNNPASH